MKKFISLFLVISMIMCNLNTGVVEALSTYVNEIKSLTNNEKQKIGDVKYDKGLEKETVQGKENNEVESTEVDGSTNKETSQVTLNNDRDNTKLLDSKNKDEQVGKSSDKKSSTDNQVDNQQTVTLIYDISSPDPDDFDVVNPNISNPEEVNLIVKGTGNNRTIDFDNEWDCEIPFNIEFESLNGTNCSFSFEHIKSIRVKGKNTITNSVIDEPALKYSFNEDDSEPLKIDTDSSFIVYSKGKDSINNIVYSGDLGNTNENSGDTSIVNISFEEDNLSLEKKMILEPIGNKSNQKKFSTKVGYNAISLLLVGDDNEYFLKEENNQKPYYYRSIDFGSDNGQISTPIKTKFILKKDSSKNYYKVSNKSRIEVIATKKITSNCYLVPDLEQAMNVCKNLESYSHEIIFVGDYSITQPDIEAIKNYEKGSNGITFKTKVDDWTYLLNIDKNLELMVNNNNPFPIIFENIKFNYDSDDKWIYANSRQLKFGYNVEMIGIHYPSVSLGGKILSSNTNIVNESLLSISSGIYNTVIGDYYGTSQNVNIIINEGIFKSKVLGVRSSSNVNENLDIIINGGTFYDEVIAVDGQVGYDAALTIQDGTFYSKVLGASAGSNIEGYLDISIDGGTFNGQVIGIDGGVVNNAKLTINGGNFNDMFIGASSSTITQKFTLNGLRNRYLFTNNPSTSLKSGNLDIEINGATFSGQVYGIYLGVTGVNINLEIKSGNFKKDVIGTNVSDNTPTIKVTGGKFKGNLKGNSNSGKGNAIINIDGNVNIPIISQFASLVVGHTKRATVLKVNKLDKGYSTGDLYLNNESKVSFNKSNETTSKLNNIELNGENNSLVLPPIDRNKDKVLIELHGNIVGYGHKLKIQFASNNTVSISKIYLIKFIELGNEDVENKYILPDGYYVRDNQEPGYVILYPQATFDLRYDLNQDKLYMSNGGYESETWWYTGKVTDRNVSLNTDDLYKYKGYDLFPNNEDRKLIFTGNSLNKNITVSNDLTNFNVELRDINLTNSKIGLNGLKCLIINGENNIDSINENGNIFTYNFKSPETENKISFEGYNSYLKICTNKNTNPFNGSKGERIDLKFHKPFREDIKEVRLKNNIETYKFNVPDNTERLGLLLKDNGYYNLYYGEGDTGNSVYVAGNTDKTFTDKFKTSSNSVEAYEDVRRANPVSTVNLEMPSDVNFGVNVRTDNIDRITKDNWENYFYATEMKFKNNSTVVQDEFIDEKGEVHHFGKADKDSNVNSDVNLEYRGIYCSDDSRNEIKLVSKDNLDSDITPNSTYGVKLALKLDGIPIDDSKVIDKPLNNWVISNNEEKTISIEPDFGNNNKFFKISKYLSNEFTLNSSHRFIFRYELRKS